MGARRGRTGRDGASGIAAWLATALLLDALLPSTAVAREDGAQILVRLRTDGPQAVTDCAEARQRRGEPLAGATRDGSDSLDRLHAELGVRRVRAVFRRPDGRSFAAQRASLRARTLALRSRHTAARPDAGPSLPDLSPVYRVELAPGVDPRAAAARYRADPHVAWAQEDFPAALDLAADDPFLSSSGSWGQAFADLWGLHRIEAPSAWDHAQGEGIVVAVVDTGVDLEHPDLTDNVWLNPGEDLDGDGRVQERERNGIDDDGNGFVDDFHGFDFANSVDANGDGDFDDPDDVSDADPFDDVGHGTHVAGIAAAVANNGIGIAGVAPRARIMALKGFGESGSATFEVLVRGMLYAIENGADVINNSWTCGRRCPRNPIVEEVVELANALGVVVVTSAGNGSDDVVFYSPENRRGTLVAGASDVQDLPTSFSNTGYGLDVLAPGAASPFGAPLVPSRAILSLRSSGANDGATGLGAFVLAEHYLRWSGTSMSSPYLAGIAALVLARRPGLTPDEVRGVIRAAARDLGDPGHDRRHGAGLADALAAVTRDPPSAGGVFEAPLPGAVLAPQAGPVTIRGRLFGDVAAAELSFGFGRDPAHFEPIPPSDAAGAARGELATWEVGALPDGPYVLRLEVEAGDGERVREFLGVDLERNPPIALSSEGPAALAPVVSGGTVVWQSQRSREDGDDEETDLDLFARDWDSGEEWRVAGGPGDQRGARLSGERLAWRDDTETSREIRTCTLRGREPCRDVAVARSEEGFTGLDLSDRALVWTGRVAGAEVLRACVWRGARCRPVPVPGGAGRRSSPVASGGRLYWIDWVSGMPRLSHCDLSVAGRCDPRPIPVDGPPPSEFAASESLLAWNLISSPAPLFGCRLRDGRCPAQWIAPDSGLGQRIAVSRHRIVWSAPGPGGDFDVFFCEHDPHTGACPVQRITGRRSNQRNPQIDGDRVVWEDDGEGFESVFGLELPSLEPLRDRRLRVGRTLRMGVRGRDPMGGAPALSAAFADGTPLSARGARFDDRGDGRGVLTWRPDPASVGAHGITFGARGAGGLVARRGVRIEVESVAPDARE